MIKYKTSTNRSQVKLDFSLINKETDETTTLPIKVAVEPLNRIVAPFDGDGVVSGNPPPHLETYEEFYERHKVDVHPIEIQRLWEVVVSNRKKAEKCGK
jgi:hypothetical protein